MRNIRFPNIDDKTEFHRIAQAKRRKKGCKQCDDYDTDKCNECDNNNRAVMIKMEPYISDRYDYYDQHLDCLSLIVISNKLKQNQKELLLNTFKSSEFDGIRKQIINNLPNAIKGICPFCMIGEPATLEHYLPKDSFPEYTLYSKNLIPCCHVCNSYKGTNYLNVSGARRFINYYIDDVENKAFLKSTICIVDGIPTVDFTIDLNKDDVLYETIISHFEYLHLFERYVNRANSIISSILDTIVNSYSSLDNIDRIVDDSVPLLKLQLNAWMKQFGKNYWKACVLKGIIDDQDMFRELIRNYSFIG